MGIFKRLFNCKHVIEEDNKLVLKVVFLGFELSYVIGRFIPFYWIETFEKYLAANKKRIPLGIKNLKKGMDEISCSYVDHFMKLTEYWSGYYKDSIWTEYDIQTENKRMEFMKTFKQPFPNILRVNPYFFSNIYGLIDLPKDVFSQINGQIIIDGGGLNGDTALMFHKYFPESPIHVYEPLSANIKVIKSILEVDNCNGKIIPIQKGLGKESAKTEISFNTTEEAEIVSLDEIYSRQNEKIGLIKLDTEGFETFIIEGGANIIKRDKPVLAVAIYHTPQDFFELKDKIQALNSEYKFMIRRSELVLPQADLVLIAY